MGARRGRRFYLGATALLGAGFVAIGFLLQRDETRRRSAPAPEPAWRSADHSAAFLAHPLRPLAAGDSIVPPRILACLRAYEIFDSAAAPIRMHMTRSLNSGHEFEAEIVMTCRSVESGQDLELSVTRANQEPLGLRLEVRSGVMTAIRQAVGAPPAWQLWTGAQDLPLALGDLQVNEVLELCQSLAGGKVTPLGYLAGMGARPQLVLETRLATAERRAPRSRGPNELDETPAVGVRALAYVDSATCELRSVRVLDTKGYLVRVYDDLVWEKSDSRSRLSELQVTSIPSSSHTVLHRVGAERP